MNRIVCMDTCNQRKDFPCRSMGNGSNVRGGIIPDSGLS